MDIRRVVAAIGRALIALGVIILLFVAYQLWGTGLAESRGQDELRSSLEEVLAGLPTTPPTTAPDPGATVPPDGGTTTTVAEDVPAAALEGEAVALIRIPKIRVDKVVIEGVAVGDLKKAPGHYPGTPLPGQPGNVAIAGHRTTYGAPFSRLDELAPGDEIVVTTRQGEFRYEVFETRIVSPRQTEVLDSTGDNRLTLTTCHPKFSARERLIVVARLAGQAAPAPPPTTTTTTAPPPTDPGAPPPTAEEEPEPVEEPVDEAGLSGSRVSKGPAIAWGSVAALIWLAAWLLSRRVGKLIAYSIGLPVFLVALFLFFENFARLLPANV